MFFSWSCAPRRTSPCRRPIGWRSPRQARFSRWRQHWVSPSRTNSQSEFRCPPRSCEEELPLATPSEGIRGASITFAKTRRQARPLSGNVPCHYIRNCSFAIPKETRTRSWQSSDPFQAHVLIALHGVAGFPAAVAIHANAPGADDGHVCWCPSCCSIWPRNHSTRSPIPGSTASRLPATVQRL